MAAELKAKISLETSEFQRSISKITKQLSSLASTFASVGATVGLALAGGLAAATTALAVGVKGALEFGKSMEELSSRTGAPIKDLIVLQQAFSDAGIEADKVGPAINKLQRALTGVNADGTPTNKMFERLGLNMQELQKMAPVQQFDAVSKAIAGLSDPAERTAAAMEIFGKSGGELLGLFRDPEALGNASKIIGKQADIFQKNAEAFDHLSNVFNSIGVKFRGFFAGVSEKLLPALTKAAEFLEGLDLAPLGEKLGSAISSAINILVNAFKTGQLGDLVGLSLQFGFMKAVDFLVRSLRGAVELIGEAVGQLLAMLGEGSFWKAIGNLLVSAFQFAVGTFVTILETPLKFLQDGMTYVFEHVAGFFSTQLGDAAMRVLKILSPTLGFAADAIAKGVGSIEKPREFTDIQKNSSFSLGGVNGKDLVGASEGSFASAKANIQELLKSGVLSGDSLAKAWSKGFESGGIFDQSLKDTEAKLAALAKKLNVPLSVVKDAAKSVIAPEGNKLATVLPAAKVDSDRLSRIGLFVGGGANATIDFARRTAMATEGMWKQMIKLGSMNPEQTSLTVWGD